MFHLFDFNEEGMLTSKELEFLIDCCMLSIFKIFRVQSLVDRDEITSFIFGNFSETAEINSKRLLTWCAKCNEIQTFFKILGKELPKPAATIKNPKIHFRTVEAVKLELSSTKQQLKLLKRISKKSIVKLTMVLLSTASMSRKLTTRKESG